MTSCNTYRFLYQKDPDIHTLFHGVQLVHIEAATHTDELLKFSYILLYHYTLFLLQR